MTPKLTRPEEVAQAARDAEELVRLREVMHKLAAWLERAALRSDQQERQNRGHFDTLADACKADAKNYRAMLRDAKRALGEE